MNFQADTLIALAFLVPVAAYAVAGLFAAGGRRLEKPSRMAVRTQPNPVVHVDVTVPAANDEAMREAA